MPEVEQPKVAEQGLIPGLDPKPMTLLLGNDVLVDSGSRDGGRKGGLLGD